MKTQSSRQIEAILNSNVLAMKRNSAKQETLLLSMLLAAEGACLDSMARGLSSDAILASSASLILVQSVT